MFIIIVIIILRVRHRNIAAVCYCLLLSTYEKSPPNRCLLIVARNNKKCITHCNLNLKSISKRPLPSSRNLTELKKRKRSFGVSMFLCVVLRVSVYLCASPLSLCSSLHQRMQQQMQAMHDKQRQATTSRTSRREATGGLVLEAAGGRSLCASRVWRILEARSGRSWRPRAGGDKNDRNNNNDNNSER